MYQACIFDLDGTLADTVDSIANVANQILERFGLPAQPVNDYKYHAGDGGDILMERCMRAAGGDFTHLEEGQKLYREIFAENPLYKVKAFDGMKETLAELKRRKVKLAVLSNKPSEATELAVKGLFGEETFSIVQGLKPGMKRKPAPDGALKIAEELGVKPEECMYVGDTNTDMQTGKAANMYTIGVLWGFRDRKELEENHADRIIEKPQELLGIQEGER
ncbi:MAG: HAD family hydrolase [Clostridiales bacterium]|nr:HAD family hydrolase [Clostridiales bacterium]